MILDWFTDADTLARWEWLGLFVIAAHVAAMAVGRLSADACLRGGYSDGSSGCRKRCMRTLKRGGSPPARM